MNNTAKYIVLESKTSKEICQIEVYSDNLARIVIGFPIYQDKNSNFSALSSESYLDLLKVYNKNIHLIQIVTMDLVNEMLKSDTWTPLKPE